MKAIDTIKKPLKTTMLTTEEYNNLITRVRSDDKLDSAIAGEHLLTAIKNYLTGFSYSFFKQLNEDVLIETLSRIWRNLHQFDSEKASFPTWSATIFKHMMYKYTNRLNKRKDFEQLNDNIYDDAMFNAGVYQEEFELEGAEDNLFADTITIVKTNPDFEMLYKHYIQGMTYEELTDEYGIPMSTVKNRMHRQRRKLKELVNT